MRGRRRTSPNPVGRVHVAWAACHCRRRPRGSLSLFVSGGLNPPFPKHGAGGTHVRFRRVLHRDDDPTSRRGFSIGNSHRLHPAVSLAHRRALCSRRRPTRLPLPDTFVARRSVTATTVVQIGHRPSAWGPHGTYGHSTHAIYTLAYSAAFSSPPVLIPHRQHHPNARPCR